MASFGIYYFKDPKCACALQAALCQQTTCYEYWFRSTQKFESSKFWSSKKSKIIIDTLLHTLPSLSILSWLASPRQDTNRYAMAKCVIIWYYLLCNRICLYQLCNTSGEFWGYEMLYLMIYWRFCDFDTLQGIFAVLFALWGQIKPN